jgi:hypothetical protein
VRSPCQARAWPLRATAALSGTYMAPFKAQACLSGPKTCQERPICLARLAASAHVPSARFPLDVVRIECQRCGRAGSYALARLIERFGADIALPDLLVALASCERRADFSRPCGAMYTDLTGAAG